MIVKTVQKFKQHRKDYLNDKSVTGREHTEEVLRESWLLFGIVLLYRRDTLLYVN